MSPKDIAIALVPPLSWGAGFTLAKPAVEQFQPLFMMAMIYVALVIVLIPTARAPIRTPWLSLFAIAAFAVPIQGVFIFLGLKYLPASVATLVLQVQVPVRRTARLAGGRRGNQCPQDLRHLRRLGRRCRRRRPAA